MAKKPNHLYSNGLKQPSFRTRRKHWRNIEEIWCWIMCIMIALVVFLAIYIVVMRRSPRTPSDVEALLEWARRHGASLDHLEARQLPNSTERGLFATATIPEGVVLAVPHELCFTSTRIFSDPVVAETFSQIFAPQFTFDVYINRRALLALYLLYHKWTLGPRSFWEPYIRALPSIESPRKSVVFLRPEEMDLLDTGDNLAQLVKTHQDAIEVMKRIVKNHAGVFPSWKISDEEVEWAYGMLLTRSWQNDMELACCPIADMMNHDRRAPVSSLIYNATHRLFVLAPGHSFRAGTEVVQPYDRMPAPISTAVTWGFVSPIEDAYLKFFTFPRENSETLTDLLEALSCDKNVPLGFHCGQPPLYPSSDLLKCMRPHFLSDAEAAIVLERVKRGVPIAKAFEPVITPELEISVAEHLRNNFFAIYQRQFRRTIAEDLELFGRQLSPAGHTAVAVSISTKQCVHHGLTVLREYWERQQMLRKQL